MSLSKDLKEYFSPVLSDLSMLCRNEVDQLLDDVNKTLTKSHLCSIVQDTQPRAEPWDSIEYRQVSASTWQTRSAHIPNGSVQILCVAGTGRADVVGASGKCENSRVFIDDVGQDRFGRDLYVRFENGYLFVVPHESSEPLGLFR